MIIPAPSVNFASFCQGKAMCGPDAYVDDILSFECLEMKKVKALNSNQGEGTLTDKTLGVVQ